jgi:3-deoxy-D-arabino-heptulosonate 7-phosphate (DAHP) synthase
MRTRDARAIRHIQAQGPVEQSLLPPDLAAAVADLKPAVERLRRGEWRLLILGPCSSRERDEAALLSARLMEIAEVVGAGR